MVAAHDPFAAALVTLDTGEAAVWVSVTGTRGSVPREPGAAMLVTRGASVGTIGGGHLEWKAIEFAREHLAGSVDTQRTVATRRHFPLGPALGQCCGGAVEITFVPVLAHDRSQWQRLADTAQRGGDFHWQVPLDAGGAVLAPGAAVAEIRYVMRPWHLWVFGAGHVGQAIVQVFASLPCQLTWVDSRDEPFPAQLPTAVRTVSADDPARKVAQIPPGADVLVLTHSHALDFDITLALLRRADLGYIGVIGSGTKAATFRKRLAARGLSDNEIARMVSPIGQPAPRRASPQRWSASKHPGVIAVSVASELLERRQLFEQTTAVRGLEA